MMLEINGEKQTIERDTLTVAELLEINKVEMPDTVSVQLNGAFANRDAFKSTQVNEGDKVDFLYFMGGGASR